MSDGFVTPSGGSVGGWAASGGVQVVTASTDDKGNNWYAEVNLPADTGSDGRVWFGGPLTVNDSDKENAGKILIYGNGNGPVDMLKGAQQAAKEKRDDSSNPPAVASAGSPATKNPPVKKISWSPMAIQAGQAKPLISTDLVGTWEIPDSVRRGFSYIRIFENGAYEEYEISKSSSGRPRFFERYKWSEKPSLVTPNSIVWETTTKCTSGYDATLNTFEKMRAAAIKCEYPKEPKLLLDESGKPYYEDKYGKRTVFRLIVKNGDLDKFADGLLMPRPPD